MGPGFDGVLEKHHGHQIADPDHIVQAGADGEYEVCIEGEEFLPDLDALLDEWDV